MSEAAQDHPITLESVAGEEIARTAHAVLLREKGHDPVHYVPRADVRMDLLAPTPKSTHCPYKGDAAYFALKSDKAGGEIAWSYEEPFPGVGGISGHLAFYGNKADIRA